MQLNVSKIIWSAKDQAEVMTEKKMKHSRHTSSSYLGVSKYGESNNKGTIMTVEGHDKNQMITDGINVDNFDSLDRSVDDDGFQHRHRDGDVNMQSKKSQEETSTFASRIPISVCALPCNVGEKTVVSTVRKI